MLTQSTCQTINIHKVYSCNDWYSSCPLISEYVSTKTYSTKIFTQRILVEEYSQSDFFMRLRIKQKSQIMLGQVSVGMFGSSTSYHKLIHIRIRSIALFYSDHIHRIFKKIIWNNHNSGFEEKSFSRICRQTYFSFRQESLRWLSREMRLGYLVSNICTFYFFASEEEQESLIFLPNSIPASNF